MVKNGFAFVGIINMTVLYKIFCKLHILSPIQIICSTIKVIEHVCFPTEADADAIAICPDLVCG